MTLWPRPSRFFLSISFLLPLPLPVSFPFPVLLLHYVCPSVSLWAWRSTTSTTDPALEGFENSHHLPHTALKGFQISNESNDLKRVIDFETLLSFLSIASEVWRTRKRSGVSIKGNSFERKHCKMIRPRFKGGGDVLLYRNSHFGFGLSGYKDRTQVVLSLTYRSFISRKFLSSGPWAGLHNMRTDRNEY